MTGGVGKAGLFITASGTGAGKTLIACALCHQLGARGLRVQGLKPVISGFDPAEAEESDSGLILRSLGRELSDEGIAAISPFLASWIGLEGHEMAETFQGLTLLFGVGLAWWGRKTAKRKM